MTGISKTFPGTRALDDISLEFKSACVHALVGGNGSGKSTLIKILAGVVAADPGGNVETSAGVVASDRITPAWADRHRLRFVHQDLGLLGGLTVAENLFVGRRYPSRLGLIDWSAVEREAKRILDGHELATISPRALVSSLRPADQTLLAIARAIGADHDSHRHTLVLDEPTARLPQPEANKLIAAMRRYANAGHTVVFVSHHLDEILGVADKISVLRDGTQVGTFSATEIGQAELTRMIAGHDVVSAHPTSRSPAGRRALEVTRLSGGQIVDLNLSVGGGEVVGIAGLVGSGRSALLELIFGARPRSGGSVRIDGAEVGASVRESVRARVAYVPEDRITQSGFMDMSLAENYSVATLKDFTSGGLLRLGSEQRACVKALRRFGVKAPGPGSLLDELSGGNQQKMVIARWIAMKPRVLLLDEPTQGVDVAARAELHRMILETAKAGAAVVLVSSDTDELLGLADRVLVLDAGRVVDERQQGAATHEWLNEYFYRTVKIAG